MLAHISRLVCALLCFAGSVGAVGFICWTGVASVSLGLCRRFLFVFQFTVDPASSGFDARLMWSGRVYVLSVCRVVRVATGWVGVRRFSAIKLWLLWLSVLRLERNLKCRP